MIFDTYFEKLVERYQTFLEQPDKNIDTAKMNYINDQGNTLNIIYKLIALSAMDIDINSGIITKDHYDKATAIANKLFHRENPIKTVEEIEASVAETHTNPKVNTPELFNKFMKSAGKDITAEDVGLVVPASKASDTDKDTINNTETEQPIEEDNTNMATKKTTAKTEPEKKTTTKKTTTATTKKTATKKPVAKKTEAAAPVKKEPTKKITTKKAASATSKKTTHTKKDTVKVTKKTVKKAKSEETVTPEYGNSKMAEIEKKVAGKSVKAIISAELTNWGIDKNSFGYTALTMLPSLFKVGEAPYADVVAKIATKTGKSKATVSSAINTLTKKADFSKSDYTMLAHIPTEKITKELVVKELLEYCER